MKRIFALTLLVAWSFAGSIPVEAQIFMGPDSAQRAQKAVAKEQKARNKAARKQQKAMQKYDKAQRKAAKRSQRHS